MKNLKWILALMVLVSTLSCKKPEEDDSGFSFTMTSQTTLLPVAQQSCEDVANGDPTVKSLSANSAVFSGITFSWAGSDNLEVQAIYVTLRGGALKTNPTKFQLAFTTNPQLSPGSTASPTTYALSCGVRLGGIELVNTHADAYLTGTIQILATSGTAGGTQELVTSQQEIALRYKGF